MKKILGLLLGALLWFTAIRVYAVEKFDILPDLPEALNNAAQASAVSTTDDLNNIVSQNVGQAPDYGSVIFSLIIVVLLIYASAILYTRLNKFGINAFKTKTGISADSRVAVVSTTPLGGNKTLHVVELEGKRMLIGASNSTIQLIKDLGCYPPEEVDEGEFSKIEIPSIRIPKIEIPKIEIPGFTKVISKSKKKENSENDENFQISDIYVEGSEENPDGIIDKLFSTHETPTLDDEASNTINEHKVDPDEYMLYKKYLEK